MSEYLPARIEEIGQFAEIAANSRLFDCTPDQAVIKLMAGASWGIPPVAAMSDIYVVKGKPQASGTLLRALVRRSGKYDYRVRKSDPTEAKIEWLMFMEHTREWESLGFSSFTMKEAQAAGLTRNQTYKSYAQDMLLARATSRGVKAHCPDVFTGSIYVEGELDDEPEVRTVEAKVVESARQNSPESRQRSPESRQRSPESRQNVEPDTAFKESVPDPTPPAPATDAQLEEIAKLKAELKIPRSSWAGRLQRYYSTDDVKQLTADQADDLLARLRAVTK